MAPRKMGKDAILAAFYDEGTCTELYAEGAVTAAFGCAKGQPVYFVCQKGDALTAEDVQKNVKVLDLAAQTGNPVVTVYDSIGAKLEDGQALVAAQAALLAKIGQVSGVVPQVAVVTGVCGGSSALAAAAADLCVMAESAELFFTAPFVSEAKGKKVTGAGSAEFAAKAGVAAIVTADTAEAVKQAAQLVALLPANNLAETPLNGFTAPENGLRLAKYSAKTAADCILDAGAQELFAGFGKNVYTALGTVNGSTVGLVATEPAGLCHNCVAKISRFVRFCDAFSIPVVTLVNSEGFVKDSGDDLAGGIREAARLAATYADATTAKVAVITGKAIGPVYSALANADLRIAVEGCTIAAVEPNTAVTVLYREEIEAAANIAAATDAKAKEYVQEVCCAKAAVAAGTADFAVRPIAARGKVCAALDMLATKRAQRMSKKHGNMAL